MAKAKTIKKANPTLKYAEFVKQLEILHIRLHDAKIESVGFWEFEGKLSVDFKTKSRYELVDDGFVIYQRYSARILDGNTKKKVARIAVTFAVYYESAIPVDDELYERFSNTNLIVNTWPYFREFVHNMSARMNLPPLVAPVAKRTV